jgi:hypothetical protein
VKADPARCREFSFHRDRKSLNISMRLRDGIIAHRHAGRGRDPWLFPDFAGSPVGRAEITMISDRIDPKS